MLIFSLFLALGFVALVVFFYQAFAAYWFGWTDLRAGFLVEMAIEPVPYRGQRLGVLDWDARSEDLPGLIYSWTYVHPDAIDLIGKWIVDSLEKKPAQI